MELDLSTRGYGDHAVVSVGGEVDLETATRLGDAALEALRHLSPHLVLDLSGVSFMDSTGLKVLLSLQRSAALAGGSLTVAGATRPVRRILTLTGLDQTLQLVDAVDAVDAVDGAVPADRLRAAAAGAAPMTEVSGGAKPTT